MVDLGIEHAVGNRVWFQCGCIALVHDDGVPALATYAIYSGDRDGFPLRHNELQCPGNFLRSMRLHNEQRHRLAEVCIELRWIENGGCPTHGTQACVH